MTDTALFGFTLLALALVALSALFLSVSALILMGGAMVEVYRWIKRKIPGRRDA